MERRYYNIFPARTLVKIKSSKRRRRRVVVTYFQGTSSRDEINLYVSSVLSLSRPVVDSYNNNRTCINTQYTLLLQSTVAGENRGCPDDVGFIIMIIIVVFTEYRSTRRIKNIAINT